MTRIFEKYYCDITRYNVFLSIMFGITVSSIMQDSLVQNFLRSFISAGFFGGLYFYHVLQKNEYFFYHNQGLSKPFLIIVSAVQNIVLYMVIQALFVIIKNLV